MKVIKRNSLEERILAVLSEKYPLTVSEMARELNSREDVLSNTLRKMQKQGVIELEVLPDKIYVRQVRFDVSFVGYREGQKKFLKHGSGKKTKLKKKDKYKKANSDKNNDGQEGYG